MSFFYFKIDKKLSGNCQKWTRIKKNYTEIYRHKYSVKLNGMLNVVMESEIKKNLKTKKESILQILKKGRDIKGRAEQIR